MEKEIKDRKGVGIMFSGDMVVSMLKDAKTMTRRKVKNITPLGAAGAIYDGDETGTWSWIDISGDVVGNSFTSPWGRVGDLLYVREDFRVSSFYERMPPSSIPQIDSVRIHYEADGVPLWSGCGKKRENMYMPRWMSRLTLELTGIRIEKLQEISDKDCWAEGIDRQAVHEARNFIMQNPQSPLRGETPEGFVYAKLWESLHGAGSWQINPFVWVLSFRVIHENIDAFLVGSGRSGAA